MAAPDHGNSAEPPQSSSAAPTVSTIVPAPYAANEQHVCFICLQNETESPNTTWVNPCPCSLEAHEHCMLRWIAEVETSSDRPKGGLKCLACGAPITVEEPYDPIVALRDHLYRRYSRLSPYLLFAVVTSGGIAGAAWYGWNAAAVFAGPPVVDKWIGFRTGRPMSPPVLRYLVLSMVGPGLVLTRALSSVGTVILLPFSLLYSTYLVAQDNLPTWPLSGEWAIALMPYVHLSYTFLYYDLFGKLEKRLNRALRGLPPAGDVADPADPARAGAEPAAAAAGARNDEEADGIWGNVGNLAQAILGLFNDLPAEAQRGAEDGGQVENDGGDANDAWDEDDLMLHEDDQFQILAGDEAEAPIAEQQIAPPPPPAAAVDQGTPQQDQPQPQPQPQPQAQNPRRNNNNDVAPGPAGVSLIGAAINNMVTSLLFPAISFGMGELIRAAVPKAWVAGGARTNPGLLQRRWGRSLAGGCLFVVLKDAIALYTKSRRVQAKLKRRVRNVARIRPPAGTEGASTEG
ncbi:hypothetical protein BT67DRAFT_445465 [Trichocladium antarcticum]|uniref:RING-CH-type domain-containing protein n=1 Tax=Trichocladium antarcticum TaxID=1450529 RepID=A0AAN6Z9D5_9PEZI|nr:hypothetical protein BT67DRAFT_445465 [Trichocladium antarcticum]